MVATFEIELPLGKECYPNALKFQSTWAAFPALLKFGVPRGLWITRFIWDAILAPLYKADIECVFYGIDDNFDMIGQIDLADRDWLFFVNYFGICLSKPFLIAAPRLAA